MAAWPDWLDDIWAKSPQKGQERGETLAEHTWQTLERLVDLMRLRPALPQALAMPRLWQVLFWAAFLHDFGKAAEGFQAGLRGQGRWDHRHEVLSLAFLDWIAAGFTSEEQAWLAAVIVSHHKDASDIAELYAPPRDEEGVEPLGTCLGDLSAEAVSGLYRWLSECAASWVAELAPAEAGVTAPALPGREQALAMACEQGVKRVRRWLDVYSRFLRQLERNPRRELITAALALRGHLINADHSASAHAGPLPRPDFNADSILASRGLSREQLDDHQRRAAKTADSVILTAPTGSGKTEAALLWAAHLADGAGGLPRLFYTLPYQASMNAMKERLAGAFGGDHVGLQHGRSLLALYRLILEHEHEPKRAEALARRARDLAKLNYPPVRVLSPYQMLKAMYRLKGYEAQLSDYHNGAFVLDEIHAYEPGRLALILGMVRYLAENYGARFFVMSATMPTIVREYLRQALGQLNEITADAESYISFRRHRLELLDGELLAEENLARIASAALSGKSVLVVCTWVERAQQAYFHLRQALSRRGVRVALLHGRFHMRDRSAKERLVRESKGLQGLVLVATQVVEVSLDIDFDTIYSEPAPLEALLQRYGRVNRRKTRHTLVPVHIFRQPQDGQVIYDPDMVAGTLAGLERQDGEELPAI